MTKVNCEHTYCTNNENGICQLEEIDFSSEHPMFGFFCAQFDDITEKEDYKNEFYKIIKLGEKEGYFKRKGCGKKIEHEEFTFYLEGDHRNDDTQITEEKSGIAVGRLRDLRGKESAEWLNRIRKKLEEHYRVCKPVAEYEPEEEEEAYKND